MGCSHSGLIMDGPTVCSRTGKCVVYNISPSQTYNLVQESLVFPKSYIVLDIRTKRQFSTGRLVSSAWGWTGAREFGEEHSWDEKFLKVLGTKIEKKTVILIGENVSKNAFREFTKAITDSKVNPRMICFSNLELLKNPRYSCILYGTNNSNYGPYEVLRSRKGKPSLFTTGVGTIQSQLPALSSFGIDTIINISSSVCASPPKCSLESFSTKYGAPDMEKIVSSIQKHLSKKKCILIVDNNNGREYAASAIAAFLIHEGVPSNETLRFLKDKIPSIDRNHLLAALSHSTGKIDSRGSIKLLKTTSPIIHFPEILPEEEGNVDPFYIEVPALTPTEEIKRRAIRIAVNTPTQAPPSKVAPMILDNELMKATLTPVIDDDDGDLNDSSEEEEEEEEESYEEEEEEANVDDDEENLIGTYSASSSGGGGGRD